ALAAVFELVSAVNKARPSRDGAVAALAAFARFEDVLGCFGPEGNAGVGTVGAFVHGVSVEELLAQRQAAKRAKDWATADRIRGQITAAGWKIVDTPTGPRLEKA